MKKKFLLPITLLMAGIMTMGTVACGGGNSEGSSGNIDSSDSEITETKQPTTVAERAVYLAKGVDSHYAIYDDEGELTVVGYYNAMAGGTDATANCYEYSAMIDMANYMYTISETQEDKAYWKGLCEGYIDGLKYFRGSGKQLSTHGARTWDNLYGVRRQPVAETGQVGGTNMVYDDLMWIIRDLIHAYKNTGETKYLDEAEYLSMNCLDGWDSTIGGIGGITWGPGHLSKHTCSNAPFISALCELADLYKDSDEVIAEDETVFVEQTFGQQHVQWDNMVGMKKYDYYLYWAKQVYDFTYNYLRNDDNTFADNLRQPENTQTDANAPGGEYKWFDTYENNIAREKFTYNVGAMVSGAAWLYRLTDEAEYLEQGRQMSEAAYHWFVKTVEVDGKEMQMYDCRATLYFNTVLLRGYLDLADASKLKQPAENEAVQAEVAKYINVFKTSLNYSFENNLLNRTLPHNYLQGWLYTDASGSDTFDSHKDVKDACASPILYAMIAVYESNHGTL